MTSLASARRTSDLSTPEAITELVVRDVRFPTSRVLRTSAGDEGHSLVFTIGRGTEVQVEAVRAFAPLVVGLAVEAALGDPGAFSRRLGADSPMRWLGPEKGVAHMAHGAIVNALWDLRARRAGEPLWQHLAGLEPEELVALVDFRYIREALTPDEALDILRGAQSGRSDRASRLRTAGYPAYTTTPGWLGYDDAKLVRLAREAVADGFAQIKLKVGGDLENDRRRLRLAREAVGPEVRIAIDANQVWGLEEAIEWVGALSEFDPYWIEEPTAPDDVLGHAAIRRAVAPVKVATGEHGHSQVLFKQLLQAGAVDVVQIDASRVAGVNENIAILLLAAKFGVPVCPHAGGVGLCEMVQHLAMFDYVAVSGTWQDRVIEHVDHLHEHFTVPVEILAGRYVAPSGAGAGARMHAESVRRHEFPNGPEWRVGVMRANEESDR